MERKSVLREGLKLTFSIFISKQQNIPLKPKLFIYEQKHEKELKHQNSQFKNSFFSHCELLLRFFLFTAKILN